MSLSIYVCWTNKANCKYLLMFADVGEEAAYGYGKLHSLLAKCTRLNTCANAIFKSSHFPLILHCYIIVLCFIIILEVQNVEDEVKEQIQSLLQEQEHPEYGMNSILFHTSCENSWVPITTFRVIIGQLLFLGGKALDILFKIPPHCEGILWAYLVLKPYE